MNTETRYARHVRTERQKARHNANVQKLAHGPVEAFEFAMDEIRPPCVEDGIPSKWTDWDSTVDDREDYEGEAPTRHVAEALCAECPLRAVQFGGSGICVDYALATGQSHGVWGGLAREGGKWLHGKGAHTAKPKNIGTDYDGGYE